jgi:hypothetical protein
VISDKWVPRSEVLARLSDRNWQSEWMMGWRDITNATNERTVISSVFPISGTDDTLSVILPRDGAIAAVLLLSNLNSLVLDFVAQRKVGGSHIRKYLIAQFPLIAFASYSAIQREFILTRALELTYTSHSMAPFARDLGYDGAPFVWEEDRRALLRAELDAWYARAYGLTRHELRYILDPAEVMGGDYPSESFRGLKKNEIAKYGEYRTARLVLQAWDRMERGEFDEISPRITVAAPAATRSVAPIDPRSLPDGAWATPTGGDVRAKILAQIAAVLKALPGSTPVALARRAALYALEPRLLTSRLQGTQRTEWLRLVGTEATPRDGIATLGLGGATGWGEAVRLLAATGKLVEDTVAQTWTPGAGLDVYFTDSWPQRAVFALAAAAAILADESAEPPSIEEGVGLTALAA